MDKISVVIPHWPFNDEVDNKLNECVASLQDYDELIVVVNDGIGYAKAVNKGLLLAKGDYIAVVNNDLQLNKGSLKDLTLKGGCMSPKINGRAQGFNGCFWVIDKMIIKTVGYLDEQFEGGYYEDDDYLHRLRLENVVVKCNESVEVTHLGGYTIKSVGKEHEWGEKNKQKYIMKWET